MSKSKSKTQSLIRLTPWQLELPARNGMLVPARIFAGEELLPDILKDETLTQLMNAARLPGIVGPVLAMPDAHQGYGLPIGGVAATDWKTGVVSPGAVGYDINCGVRLAATDLTASDIHSRLEDIVAALHRDIPAGLGESGHIRLTYGEEKRVLKTGAEWALKNGFGDPEDTEYIEDGGRLSAADPACVSDKALERGKSQLGTLGSGNHFVEISVVDRVEDEDTARAFGLFEGQVTVMIHTGSRGLGHQICDDYAARFAKKPFPGLPPPPVRQLAGAPIDSEPGRQYLAAMACAANFAWAARQVIAHLVQESLMRALSISPRMLGMRPVYDVSHNMAKKETHYMMDVQAPRENQDKKEDGSKIKIPRILCVHRKGATRAFGPGHPALPRIYRSTGQPVLVPGDMGTGSWVLAGTETAMKLSFGSACHGAGRRLSRSAAGKQASGRSIRQEMEDRGIHVRARGRKTLSEEMPDAYKSIDAVVDVIHGAGLARKTARLRPLAVIKG